MNPTLKTKSTMSKTTTGGKTRIENKFLVWRGVTVKEELAKNDRTFICE